MHITTRSKDFVVETMARTFEVGSLSLSTEVVRYSITDILLDIYFWLEILSISYLTNSFKVF